MKKEIKNLVSRSKPMNVLYDDAGSSGSLVSGYFGKIKYVYGFKNYEKI